MISDTNIDWESLTKADMYAIIRQTEEQNAKLLELVRDLYAEYGFAHARMRYIVLQHEERMREIEQRMRKLGVEVDE